jgi:hypothetical protein
LTCPENQIILKFQRSFHKNFSTINAKQIAAIRLLDSTSGDHSCGGD